MVFVPLLSWNDDNTGSLGNLSKLTKGEDSVNQLLLELIIVLSLRNEEWSAVRAIFPVLIGPADKGTFSPFPFHKLKWLSDSPSDKTNKVACKILTRLGVRQEKMDGMMSRSVRQTVEVTLRNRGMQVSEVTSNIVPFGMGAGAAFTHTLSVKVLRTVQQELRAMRTDPEQFCNSRPMADEVLEFLSHNCLGSYADVLANHDVDSLLMLAALDKEQVARLNEEHEDVYPLRGKQGSIGGNMSLQLAINSLEQDERALPLRVRLERYKDTHSSATAALVAGNAVEMVFSKPALRRMMAAYGLNYVALDITTLIMSVVQYSEQECRGAHCSMHACTLNIFMNITTLIMVVVQYVNKNVEILKTNIACIHTFASPL
jgi:hypothetical protein